METAAYSIGTTRFGSTRHPFRASLPRRVLRALPRHEPEVARLLALGTDEPVVDEQPGTGRFGITTQNVKDFLLAYTACLLALLTFLG